MKEFTFRARVQASERQTEASLKRDFVKWLKSQGLVFEVKNNDVDVIEGSKNKRTPGQPY